MLRKVGGLDRNGPVVGLEQIGCSRKSMGCNGTSDRRSEKVQCMESWDGQVQAENDLPDVVGMLRRMVKLWKKVARVPATELVVGLERRLFEMEAVGGGLRHARTHTPQDRTTDSESRGGIELKSLVPSRTTSRRAATLRESCLPRQWADRGFHYVYFIHYCFMRLALSLPSKGRV